MTDANWERFLETARLKDKDELIRCLLKRMHRTAKRSKMPLWSLVGETTGHGSGVSAAIVGIYYPEGKS